MEENHVQIDKSMLRGAVGYRPYPKDACVNCQFLQAVRAHVKNTVYDGEVMMCACLLQNLLIEVRIPDGMPVGDDINAAICDAHGAIKADEVSEIVVLPIILDAPRLSDSFFERDDLSVSQEDLAAARSVWNVRNMRGLSARATERSCSRKAGTCRMRLLGVRVVRGS